MAKTEAGAMALPGGTLISAREWEAFKDNYRHSPEGNPPSGFLARDLSDMVLPVLASEPAGDRVLAILAENYDDRGVHSSPAPATPYAQANRIFYRGAFRSSGTLIFPGALPPPAVTSVGPLAFDESRHALAGTAFPPQPAKDPLWPGSNHSGSGLAHPAVESSGTTGNTENPPPYLRSDLLHRQKLKAIDQQLEPSAVFLRDVTEGGNTKSEFLVTYCRPTNQPTENSGESYDPDAGNGNGQPNQLDQKYFAPFKQPSGGPWKYEIWADKVKVHHDGSVTIESRELLRTHGEHAESDLHSNGFTAHASPTPGASAIMPRLFRGDEGDAVLVYLKSQDSWFDVMCDYGSGQLDLAAWENQSSWHVYPWDVFAMLWDKDSQDWIRDTHGGPKEYRISPLYPGGWNQWFADTKVSQRWLASPENLPNNPRSVRRPRLAEFFPAIEPTATVWREGTTLKAAAYFKMLNTRLPDIFGWGSGAKVPFGYDVMFTKFNGSAWSVPARLYCSLCMPPDEVPDNYDSHEHVFVQNGLHTVRAPGVSVEPLTIFQLENFVHVSNGQDVSLWPGEAVSQASPRRFVTDSMIARSGDGNAVVAAWFSLVRVGGTLRVRLTVKGKQGSLAATPTDSSLRFASEFTYPDFEARLVGLDYSAAHAFGGHIFRVTWIEQTKLWSMPVWLNGSTISAMGNATQVPNGVAARSPKLKASTTRGPGVLLTRNGTALFHQW